MNPARQTILLRLIVVAVLLYGFGISIGAKMFLIQTIDKAKLDSIGQNLSFKDVEIKGNRGNIFDSNGALLATTITQHIMRLDFHPDGMNRDAFINQLNKTSQDLALLFGTDPDSLRKALAKQFNSGKNRSFLVCPKLLTESDIAFIRSIPYFKTYAKNGLVLEPVLTRLLPFEEYASHTIGKAQGLAENWFGIEQSYDGVLAGKPGRQTLQRVGSSSWQPISNVPEISPQDGADVYTTLDMQLQDILESALAKRFGQDIDNELEWGTAVLMETKTGKIRAIVNKSKDSQGKLVERDNYALRARSTPGSTFKAFTYIVFLEDGVIGMNDIFDLSSGKENVYGIKDYKDVSNLGIVNTHKMFASSSNSGPVRIIKNHYMTGGSAKAQEFMDRIHQMKIGELRDFQIQRGLPPLIIDPSSKAWDGLSLPSIAIGYVNEYTPIQILSMYNAIANNGTLLKPYFVDKIVKEGQEIESFNPIILNGAICSKATIKKIQTLLREVVEIGSGKSVKNPNFGIAAKTGTSQIAFDNTGFSDKDNKTSYLTTFVGYFPFESPRYTCIVSIRTKPTLQRSKFYGSNVSGPVFKNIAENIFIVEKGWKKQAVSDSITGKSPTAKRSYKTALQDDGLPNVIGMGLNDALYILQRKGYQTHFKGVGKVSHQYPEAGSLISSGTVDLTLSLN